MYLIYLDMKLSIRRKRQITCCMWFIISSLGWFQSCHLGGRLSVYYHHYRDIRHPHSSKYSLILVYNYPLSYPLSIYQLLSISLSLSTSLSLSISLSLSLIHQSFERKKTNTLQVYHQNSFLAVV